LSAGTRVRYFALVIHILTTSTHELPLRETVTPDDAAGVGALLREAHRTQSPVYPIGGGTSLSYGRPATREGSGLSLSALHRIVDYPARDMTITVEAGIGMAHLQETLAGENQQLPVDVPDASRATLGGVLATNWNGPRRAGHGPLRDYVIGIEAVDGRGMLFHGGGRVVKNVAGYDFCKLLTGSLGTLGVITQVTLKLRPIAARRVTVVCQVARLADVETLLTALAASSLQPISVNLMAGPSWSPDQESQLAVSFEGGESQVAWQVETLAQLWRTHAVTTAGPLDAAAGTTLHQQAVDFPASSAEAIVLKAALVPSGVVPFVSAVRELLPACDLLAHAANGIVLLRLAEEPADLGKLLQAQLRPLAAKHHGQIVLLARPGGGEMTSHMVWGGLGDTLAWMRRIKQQFDPEGILNPGRFVF
jgi:glycolate oxidase FAD binding subunit